MNYSTTSYGELYPILLKYNTFKKVSLDKLWQNSKQVKMGNCIICQTILLVIGGTSSSRSVRTDSNKSPPTVLGGSISKNAKWGE